MHIDQLRNLVLIHRIGSINKASEQAHMSQQALNTSMKKLEAEVGCPLLMRHTRGVYLSENGLLLEKAAEEILKKLDDTLDQLKVIKPSIPPREHLVVFFSPAIGNTFIPELSKLFTQRYHSTQLMLMEKETNDVIQLITEDSSSAIGLVATFEALPTSSRSHIVLPIFKDKLYVTLAPSHPLAKQKSVSMSTVLKYPLAVYQADHHTANTVCHLIEQYGTPEYQTITNSLPIYQNAILYQQAIGFINKSAIKNHTALPDIISEIITLPIRTIPDMNFFAIVTTRYLAEHHQSIEDLLTIYKSLF